LASRQFVEYLDSANNLLLKLIAELSRECRNQIITIVDRACVLELIAKTASPVAIDSSAIVGIRKLRIESYAACIPPKHKLAILKNVADGNIVFTL
jgi:hypothetical protein